MPESSRVGEAHFGPQGILVYLEKAMGLPGAPREHEYLRIEQYRQALAAHLKAHPDAFFKSSFATDPFAVATDLLQRRDELMLAGWDFKRAKDLPGRLRCLADIEHQLKGGGAGLALGYADRLLEVLEKIQKEPVPFHQVKHCEPRPFLPVAYRRLLDALESAGVHVEPCSEPQSAGTSDLARVQRSLLASGAKGANDPIKLSGDGSLLLLRGQRDTALSAYFAQLLRQNPDWRPALLLPFQSQVLGHALEQEGLPSLGLLSASLARPTLQVLKLATVFLWDPIDPYKVMEFVSLAVKPLERGLANRIANLMAVRPGFFGEQWRSTIAGYFNDLRQREGEAGQDSLERASLQYDFWFRRARYHITGTAPKAEAIKIYNYIRQWAKACFEEEGNKNASLLVLSEQAQRIVALLHALPEEQLSPLELERVVRTIYEPAPVQLNRRAQGFLRHTTHPGGVIGPVGQLVWWNFAESERPHFFSRWYAPERTYLAEAGVELTGPGEENRLQLWQRRRPLLYAREQLVLVAPDFINGQAVNLHPLMGDLQAKCANLEAVTCTPEGEEVKKWLVPPRPSNIPCRQLGQPKPFLQLKQRLSGTETIDKTVSYSSLSDLFYYPYQWVLKYKAQLRPSALLSIVTERALMGNLAHRFFEELLQQEDVHQWSQPQVIAYLEEKALELLPREGTVLLMYGREPERARFIELIKRSAWNLIRHIQENGWQVQATEQMLEGQFDSCAVTGYADLVLRRGDELAILDLKWSGYRYRESLLRNEEDLQLVLYARMMGEQKEQWAHTAFYIINKGLILARNSAAFQAAQAVVPEADAREVNHRIWERMIKTFRWRQAQMEQGLVEVRCSATLEALEEEYAAAPMLDLLEMKAEDAPFDEYRVLINLVK